MSSSTAFYTWLIAQSDRRDSIGIFACMAKDFGDAPRLAMRMPRWRKWLRAHALGGIWDDILNEAFSEFARSR